MRRFLAAATIALHFGPASAAPDHGEFTFDASKGTYQTADLGGKFDHLNTGYPLDKLVQDIDKNFVTLLDDLWNAEVAASPNDTPRDDFMYHFYRYSQAIESFEGAYDENREQNAGSIGLCKAQQYHTFFSNYYDSFETFAYEYYELSDEAHSQLGDIVDKINRLGDQIGFQYTQTPDQACRIIKT